jgi:phosphoglycerol transferase MdoB-like AlkP superfamily enzyme
MASTAPNTTRTTRGATVGRVAAVAGSLLVIIGSFLEWAGRNFPESFSGFEVPAKFVIDSKANLDGGGLPIGVVVLIVGLLGVVGGALPRFRLVAIAAGVVAAVIAILFAVQLNDFMSRANRIVAPGGFGVRNTVGAGAVLTGAGGVLAVLGGVLTFIPPGFWSRLTSEETPEEEKEKPADGATAPS